MSDYRSLVENIGIAIDLAGVGVILLGGLAVTVVFISRALRTKNPSSAYRPYRRGLGRAILLGLEFLVAGDIIRTVAIEPTFQSLGILGGLVLIRTLLSFSLEVELTGSWPWDRKETDHPPAA